MEPSPDMNQDRNLSTKSLITQLNAFCQADVKSLWTTKRLRNSREVCGFSYVENTAGEWVMMPTLCPNCYNILDQAIKGLECKKGNSSNQQHKKTQKTTETIFGSPYPSPLSPLPSDSLKSNSELDKYVADTDYLLYPATGNTKIKYGDQPGLEFYRPSLASSGCCTIL